MCKFIIYLQTILLVCYLLKVRSFEAYRLQLYEITAQVCCPNEKALHGAHIAVSIHANCY